MRGKPSASGFRPGLVVAAATLVVILPAFVLLYLSVPTGRFPLNGFAALRGGAFDPVWGAFRFSLSRTAFSALALSLLAAMWVSYLGAVWTAWRIDRDGGAAFVLRVAWWGAGTAAALLVLVPPALSGDLFHYALFGRMVVEHGLNPYVTTGDAIPGDPFWAYAEWRWLTTHYGPVFTWCSAAAVWLGRGSVLLTAAVWKTLTAACGAACLLAVRRLLRGHPAAAVLLTVVALNPVFLIETAGTGHNEVVMMAPALWGYAMLREGRSRWGVALLTLSVHVKWVSAALVLFAFVEQVQMRPRRLALIALEWLLVAGLLSVALYLPFWEGPATFASLLELVGQGKRMVGDPAGGLRWAGGAAFLAITAASGVVVWRSGGRRTLEMTAVVSLAFVLLVFDWRFPWYTLPALLTAGGVAPDRRSRVLLALAIWGGLMLMLPWASIVGPPG